MDELNPGIINKKESQSIFVICENCSVSSIEIIINYLIGNTKGSCRILHLEKQILSMVFISTLRRSFMACCLFGGVSTSREYFGSFQISRPVNLIRICWIMGSEF